MVKHLIQEKDNYEYESTLWSRLFFVTYEISFLIIYESTHMTSLKPDKNEESAKCTFLLNIYMNIKNLIIEKEEAQ